MQLNKEESMPEKLNFKAWLAMNRISQTEVAKVLGVTLQAVNSKVNGKSDFTLKQIKKICETYDVSADIFL
jgi:putative transcriptional regulator